MMEDPDFAPNNDFGRDLVNVLTGIVWQMSQVVIPIYFMIHENGKMMVWGIVFLATSYVLKVNWWNKLKDEESKKSKEIEKVLVK
jgi:solute:Na+ symporter, SSS family